MGKKSKYSEGLSKLSYYESKLKLLRSPDLDATLLLMGCWDADVPPDDLSHKSGFRRYVKRCTKFYQKEVRKIKKQLGIGK